MRMRLIFITTILSIFLLLIGCAAQTNLKDYEPKSPDEEAIVKVLIKVQDAWNNKDLDEFLAAFHDNGEILYGIGASGVPYSKEKYAKVFSQQRGYVGPLTYVNPIITITGDKAIARVITPEVNMHNLLTYSMVKENGSWYIMRDKW